MDAMRVVRAAGGVVWRDSPAGTEVALVYRPRYQDWTLPKGKLEPGESNLAAAVREVAEETGIEAVPQLRLPTIQYLTGEPGVEKLVDFWAMRVRADHGHRPDDEVQEVRWVPVPQAPALLTYAHDRGVLAAFAELPPVTGEVLLVRHARAGSREAWTGPDEQRPLDPVGRRQASELASVLRLFAPDRAVSAPPVRCRETLAPLGLPVTIDPAFEEDSTLGPADARAQLLGLANATGAAVVCSQGTLISALLATLHPRNATAAQGYETPKGGGWLLAIAGTVALAADRLPAPGSGRKFAAAG